jgi:hypothetical protein
LLEDGNEILAVVPSTPKDIFPNPNNNIPINKAIFIENWHKRVWEEMMMMNRSRTALDNRPLPWIEWGEKPPTYKIALQSIEASRNDTGMAPLP